jgi:hypothetical protein
VAIQKALRGPIAGVLAQCVPQLTHVPHDQVYDEIMDNPRLADTCFKLFRSERARFNDYIRRPDGTPLEDDDDMMTCGRTLADAVTAIVRAMARRYFVTFDRSGPTRERPAPPSAWTRMMMALEMIPQPDDGNAAKPSRAEELFRALREFLLYEWQVPLIPYYAPLPVRVARAAGPLLLLLREPAQIEALGQMRLSTPETNNPRKSPRRTERKQAAADDAHPSYYLPPKLGSR